MALLQWSPLASQYDGSTGRAPSADRRDLRASGVVHGHRYHSKPLLDLPCSRGPDPRRILDTVPFRIQPTANRKLLLNLDGIGPDGKVLVEVLSASDRRPIEGFSRADCEPVPGALDVPVHWKGGKRLEDIPPEEGILRFHLSGPDTRFHGFRFGM